MRAFFVLKNSKGVEERKASLQLWERPKANAATTNTRGGEAPEGGDHVSRLSSPPPPRQARTRRGTSPSPSTASPRASNTSTSSWNPLTRRRPSAGTRSPPQTPSPESSRRPSIVSTSTRRSSSSSAATSVPPAAARPPPSDMLYVQPAEPLVVLFTSTIPASEGGASDTDIVALSFTRDVRVDYGMCKCASDQLNCCLAVLMFGKKHEPLPLRRLRPGAARRDRSNGTGSPPCNILGLAAKDVARARQYDAADSAKAWNDIIRITLEFESPEDRKKFAGHLCECPQRNVGEVWECLKLGHKGTLGYLTEQHRRDLEKWGKRHNK